MLIPCLSLAPMSLCGELRRRQRVSREEPTAARGGKKRASRRCARTRHRYASRECPHMVSASQKRHYIVVRVRPPTLPAQKSCFVGYVARAFFSILPHAAACHADLPQGACLSLKCGSGENDNERDGHCRQCRPPTPPDNSVSILAARPGCSALAVRR